MRLIVAEKPSLARAIAEAIGIASRASDHLACTDGSIVAWCKGHILETAPPDDYDPALKVWRLEDLPIVPTEWKLVPTSAPLLKTLRALLKKASRVVHAGDPDREGQLLVDEVLTYLAWRGPVDRLLVRDTNPDAIRRQLTTMKSNTEYQALSQSALGRQRADWLYGYNLTRLYTLLGRAAGYDGGVLSVGRVQTPLLGLVARRDDTIANFRPRSYFTITATLRTASARETPFVARWQPADAHAEHLDDEKRLLSRPVADAIRQHVAGVAGNVTDYAHDRKSQPPPLPYSLADLQVDAARRHGSSAQAVLDAAQSLYEKHRLTTYPRSDCCYLPEGHHVEGPQVLAAIASQAPALAASVRGADRTLRSRAWNDQKITAHHGIIPTAVTAPASLSLDERAIYELVARRYVLQFYPAHEYYQTTVTVTIADERFVARGRQALAAGWRGADAPELPAESADKTGDNDTDAATPNPLPPMRQGDLVQPVAVEIGDKLTQPPKRFTDATLLAAMVNIAAFVTDPAVKRILTEADGIGTSATRAAIIETLFERRFLTRDGKAIVATPTGRSLVAALPAVATTPDLTAVWEAALRAIVDGRQDLPAFLRRVTDQLHELVAAGRAQKAITVDSAPPPAAAAAPRRRTSPSRRAQR